MNVLTSLLQDGEMKSVTWGDLYVQFQGKVSDRVLCYCVLKGESFFFQNTKVRLTIGPPFSLLLAYVARFRRKAAQVRSNQCF